MHPSKGVSKNMPKASNFHKNKFRHRYSNNNLQKVSQGNILEGATKHILFIV